MKFITLNFHKKTALHIAIAKGNYDIAMLLLQHKGINVNLIDAVLFIFVFEISISISSHDFKN